MTDPAAVSSTERVGALSEGEPCRAFYHANDHPQGYRYVRLLDNIEDYESGGLVVGLSTGFIIATVAEPYDPAAPPDPNNPENKVLVRLIGRFADAYFPTPVDGLYWRVHRKHIVPLGEKTPEKILSMTVIRWWDYYNNSGKNNKARTYNVLNENMILDVCNGIGSAHAVLGDTAQYEVYSAFVRQSDDLDFLTVPLGDICEKQRAVHKASLFFLWPTQRRWLEKKNAGMVNDGSLFNLMRRLEDNGVRNCWPHNSKLYRELCGKLWTARMSQDPDYQVPNTITVSQQEWEAEASQGQLGQGAKFAAKTIEALMSQAQSNPAKTVESFQGVAKLGFSWMGEDVLPFKGPQELADVLGRFLRGTVPDIVCMVQERIEHAACEIRCICHRDDTVGEYQIELVRMRLHPPKHNDATFALTSANTMKFEEARDACFCGSSQALHAAEEEARRLAKKWLEWFPAEGFSTPASCRLDFLCQVKPKGGGYAGGPPEVKLYTIELCECGGSLCNLNQAPRTVAVLNECVEANKSPKPSRGPNDPFPQPLPSWKNDSAKMSEATEAQFAASAVSTLSRQKPWKILGILGSVVLLLLRLWLRRRR